MFAVWAEKISRHTLVSQTPVPESVSNGLIELLKQGGFATGMVVSLLVAAVFYRLYRQERQANLELVKTMTAQSQSAIANEAKFEDTAKSIGVALAKAVELLTTLKDDLRDMRLRLEVTNGRRGQDGPG